MLDSKRLVFVKRPQESFDRSGFSLIDDDADIPEYAEFSPDVVTPYLSLALKEYTFSSSTHITGEEKNVGEVVDKKKNMFGVAEVTNPSNSWGKHDFIIVTGGGVFHDKKIITRQTDIDLTITCVEEGTSLVAVGAVERAFVQIYLAEKEFNELLNDINKSSNLDHEIRVGVNLDFENLFYTFDPIGGEQRTTLFINNADDYVENFDEIPEEFVTKYQLDRWSGGTKKIPFEISVATTRKSNISSEEADTEKEDGYKFPAPVNAVGVSSGVKARLDALDKKIDRIFGLLIFVAVVVALKLLDR